MFLDLLDSGYPTPPQHAWNTSVRRYSIRSCHVSLHLIHILCFTMARRLKVFSGESPMNGIGVPRDFIYHCLFFFYCLLPVFGSNITINLYILPTKKHCKKKPFKLDIFLYFQSSCLFPLDQLVFPSMSSSATPCTRTSCHVVGPLSHKHFRALKAGTSKPPRPASHINLKTSALTSTMPTSLSECYRLQLLLTSSSAMYSRRPKAPLPAKRGRQRTASSYC